MAQLKIAEYTFNNSEGDCLPRLEPNTITMTSEDSVNGTTTTRIVYIDDSTLPTRISFSNQTSLLTVDYLRIDSNITTTYHMFSNCFSLTSLNLSNFNTQNVTNMNYMFYGCSSLTSLNLSNFNTQKVTNMGSMFQNCSKLTFLDVSNFNTQNVTSMYCMFYGCSKLTFLDVSNFNTQKVTSSDYMFNDWTSDQTVCISSKWTIDTSSYSATFTTFTTPFLHTLARYTFDNTIADCLPTITGATTSQWRYTDIVNGNITTRIIGTDEELTITQYSFFGKSSLLTVDYLKGDSNITTTYRMFYNCSKLTSLNLSNFNTEKVTNMSQVFVNCSSLTSLDVSNFNTQNVTNMSQMFQNCSSLTSLDVSKFDTSAVTNMSYMFSECKKLTALDVSNWNVEKVTTMAIMFKNCAQLRELDVSKWNTYSLTAMGEMFRYCGNLTNLDFSNFNTSKVTSMGSVFSNMGKLKSVKFGENWDTSQVTALAGLFASATSLVELDLSHWDTGKCTNFGTMFHNCRSLKVLDVSSFNTKSATTLANMFGGCSSLEKLDISNFHITSSMNITTLITGSTKLAEIGMLYCDAYTINTFATLVATGQEKKIWHYDAEKNELTPQNTITFKKYSFPTKVQLPPHIHLHSLLDGTRDEVDLAIGILTRNVGYIMLSGDENISKSSLSNDSYSVFVIEDYNEHLGQQIKPLISNQFGYIENIGTQHYGKDVDKEGISYHTHVNGLRISISSRKSLTVEEFRHWLKQNKVEIMFNHKPTTEQLILNYNNSCDYGRILPTGMCDKYDVVNSMYTQTMTSILLNGVNIWNDIADLGTVLKFTATGTTVGVDNLNMKGAGDLYCDNDLFPNINDDSDVEHCRVDVEGNKFYIYVDKERLMSPDLIGWQIWLQTNPFNMWYELEEHLIYTKPYEELDPTQARWNTMDCTRDGTIKYNTHTEDGLTIYPTLEYVAPSINNFEVPMLEPNTEYTMYAEGIGEGDTINLGGNDINFNNGTVYTSGENQWLRIDNNDSFYNVVITKGDTTGEVVPYFEGMTSVENPKVQCGGSTVSYTDLKLRSLPNGVKDTINAVTGEYIQRVGEREYQVGDLENENVLTDGINTVYELENYITTKLDPQTLLAYTDGTINLSSDTGLLPTTHYTVPSTNTFRLPSMKTGTRYTLKYPSASGSITIGDINYSIFSDSMLFTTPLKINGDTSAITFSDTNPENVMLLEGAYNKREIPFFTGVKSVKNPNITIINQLSTESITYNCATEIELRGLPNGVADKLDIIKGKLTTNVGIRPYQEGDENLPNIWTDGYETVYALSSPVVTNVTFDHPTVTANSLIELSSDYLIPQLNYRVLSSNNFPLDLLQPNQTYTLYADALTSGSYTLGGTKTGIYSQPHTITLGDMTDNLLTFNGDLGLSNVMLVKGNSLKTTLPPYFSGIRSVTDGHLLIEGMAGEINEITFDEGITLMDCNGVEDTIDLITGTLTKRTGEITLTGVEEWRRVDDESTASYNVFKLTLGGLKEALVICDTLQSVFDTKVMDCIYAHTNELCIVIANVTIGGNNVNALKSWLNQHPTTVIYQLRTPVEVQLKNIWTTLPPTSYNNQTKISSTVSLTSLKPMISVTIATTTLEEIVTNLEAQNEELENENVTTMLALTSFYETFAVPITSDEPSTINLSDGKDSSNLNGMSISPMSMIYAKLIKKGLKTIEQVPTNLQAEVKYVLKE